MRFARRRARNRKSAGCSTNCEIHALSVHRITLEHFQRKQKVYKQGKRSSAQKGGAIQETLLRHRFSSVQ